MGNRSRQLGDEDHMTCEMWREALSARLDGEEPPAGGDEVEAHLAVCPRCGSYAAELGALHRATRLQAAEPVPDLTQPILAGAPARPRRRGTSRVLVAAAVALPLLLLAGALAWSLSRSSATSPPVISYAAGYATVDPIGRNAVVYLSITNDGGADDLVGAETPVAQRASLHASEQRDGFVFMSNRSAYPIPEDGTIAFRPGGAHVMLEGLEQPLVVGDRIAITLRFQRSTPLHVTATVVPLTDIVGIVGWDGEA